MYTNNDSLCAVTGASSTLDHNLSNLHLVLGKHDDPYTGSSQHLGNQCEELHSATQAQCTVE
jgi:hypothetical protein